MTDHFEDDDDIGMSYMEPLLVDYSLLTSSSAHESANELDKFKSELTSWGCFQLINHGIATSFLDELQETSRQFFGLPTECKTKYAMPKDDNNGYDGKNITNSENQQILDWNEGLTLTVFPEDRRRLQYWPDYPSNFKTLVHEYAQKMEPVCDELFRKVLQSLNVSKESYDKQYGKNKEMNVRFNFYPASPSSRRGLGAHADFSPMTLLLQDEEGLQILKDGQWFKVPVISGALFLSIGDPTEIMTNGIFKSAVHRVVTKTEKARLSIALFWDSDRNGQIGPFDELITSSRPQQYQRVSLQHYITKFPEYYRSGERLIEAIRLLN
ncbi:protein SRG1-like [Silene latifolia]|uniref:protein SRG1-like n=1 Tax=Silene latifolia TaxID=37657 RepID=UPI003D76FF6F